MTALALPVFVPACMDADELALWRRRPSHTRRRAVWRERPCDDCTLGYAADMRAAGRCNGTPGGVEEEDVEATIPALAVARPAPAGTSVAVVAPCDRCIHAAVCRLRPPATLAGSARLPEVAPELTVVLTATVTCTEFASRPRTYRMTPEGRAPKDRGRPSHERRPAGSEGGSLTWPSSPSPTGRCASWFS